MLGLMVIGITLLLIFTLVKNALFGKQVTTAEPFTGPIELILPILPETQFITEQWQRTFSQLRGINLKVYFLIDGHHADNEAIMNFARNNSFVEVNSFLTRPPNALPVPWMIQQLAHRLTGDVIVIGDADLIPSEHLFGSLGKIVMKKKQVTLLLPQTAKTNIVGEALSTLNPNLAFVSLYGQTKLRRNLSNPFLALSLGWVGMPLAVFKNISFENLKHVSWKVGIVEALNAIGIHTHLAFGEKHLLRPYSEYFEDTVRSMKSDWGLLWNRKELRKSFWFFIVAIFVWSFPIICFASHPFWAIGSFFLLVLYRFFTKIVFQESWVAVLLHPFACLIWIVTLVWWIATSAKTPSGPRHS
jgi:hypothetical protein